MEVSGYARVSMCVSLALKLNEGSYISVVIERKYSGNVGNTSAWKI